jgi:hypothetical protein
MIDVRLVRPATSRACPAVKALTAERGAFLRHGYVMLFVGAAVDGDASLLTGAFLAHRG